ncbi:MAG: hypothetical protein IKN34_09600, partial [Treponema sp.]|nr:hypothetical protein [Treponema sp.]
MYLKGREVFAYDALNSDAEKVAVRCAIVGRGIEGVMEDIVRFSYEEGFLKDGRDVKITLVDAFATESNSNDILKEAE